MVASITMLVWPILVMLVLLAWSPGCVTTPDGRRVLSPGARRFGGAMLEHVLTCGSQAALAAGMAAATGGDGQPNPWEVSTCHLNLIREQLGRESGPAPQPSEEHGRKVLEAYELERNGAPRREYMPRVRECDAMARELNARKP